MILILHIIIALSSLAQTAYILFYPSNQGLKITYALVALTLITGFYLVITMPANITQTCVTGLVYLGVVSFGIVSAKNKLAK